MCVCVYARACARASVRAHMYVCLYVCEFECVPACAFLYTCVCICMRVCICVCMRVHLMEKKLDTCQSSRGRLGRSNNAKTDRNSEILRIDGWTD